MNDPKNIIRIPGPRPRISFNFKKDMIKNYKSTLDIIGSPKKYSFTKTPINNPC